MNERIRQLAEQATSYKWDGYGEEEIEVIDAEKFAELIIRECIAVIEKNMPEFTCKEEYDNLYRKAGRLDAIEEIQEHFGVE